MADVLAGDELVCEPVRLAVERQARDLERQKSSDFEYFFDEAEASKVLNIISLFRHTKGEWKGRFFEMQDFQAFRLAVVFGWRRKDDLTRRYRRAYIEIARKNGKTEEAAAVMLYGLLDGEPTAEVYSAATTYDQASIAFKATKIMAKSARLDSESVSDALNVLTFSIQNIVTDGFCQPLTSDAKTLDGKGPYIAVIDEYHEHPTPEVLNVLESGMGARRQPLSYIITTAGFNIESPCYALRKTALEILRGVKEDETFFTIIYTIDEGDDWQDLNVWKKANPGIGNTPKWESMKSAYQKALNEGETRQNEFKTKNLNVWVRSSKGWIPDHVWMACPAEPINPERGALCYAGIDLASTSDFSALALFFPGDDSRPHGVKLWLWLPEAAFEKRARDFPAFDQWRADGWITVTPGNVMDYDYIEQKMLEICEELGVHVVGIDPANAQQLRIKLESAGVPIELFSQGIMSMSHPTKEWERLVNRGLINHENNPVLRWMMGNVHIWTDANGNIKAHKGKSNDKIDGVVAAIIALGEYLTQPQDVGSYLARDGAELLTV